MTPTPPSTNSSTTGRSPEEQYRVVRKRNRVPLSCYPCRTRKLKCDRSHPCSNCTRREGADTSSCSYATPVNRKKGRSQGELSPDDMQNRIDRLEGLVLSLMHNGGNVDADTAAAVTAATATRSNSNSNSGNNNRGRQPTSRSITDSGSSSIRAGGARDDRAVTHDDGSDDDYGLISSLGTLKVDVDKGKSMYMGQEHWHSILAEITEVKTYFTNHKKELEASFERMQSSKPVDVRGGPTLLLGAAPASEAELRNGLPSRSDVATLCNRFFNSMDNAVSILHRPTFQQKLRAHWQEPTRTPVMWLGLLYSILTLAMLSYHKAGDELPQWRGQALEMASLFRLRTVQCLVRADYTKPVEYTVETLILYTFGEHSTRWDADIGLWMVMALTTRTAFRMGYHRDAKWFPSITPFQAEMRRRTWALLRMSDVIFSHQVSLPNMINENDCDTQLPNNIYDAEFYPDIKELPPSRPATEATPLSYMIAKSRLCNELGNILQALNGIAKHVSYDEIIRFDARIRQIMRELPPHLKLTATEGSEEPVTLLLARFNVDNLAQRILCLLHRRYLPRARLNPRYAHSRRSAVDASMRALNHLVTMHHEARPGGKLESVKWYVRSIATNDFTMAAILLILELHHDNMWMQKQQQQQQQQQQPPPPPADEGSFAWNPEQRKQMIDLLEKVQDIWASLEESSMDALKASKVTQLMLGKIKKPATAYDSLHRHMDMDSPAASAPNPPGARFGGDTSAGSAAPISVGPSGFLPDMSKVDDDGSMGPAPPPGLDSGPFMGMDLGTSPSTHQFDLTGDGGAGWGGGRGDVDAAMAGSASPFSILNIDSGQGAMPDLMANLDWGALENYAQVANWSVDLGFPMTGSQAEESFEEYTCMEDDA
ncbi:Fungal trans, partial [Geosmithia morbida]